MRFDQHFVQSVLPDVQIPYAQFPSNISFAVDSRAVMSGDVFVALPGEKVDGHQFCAAALDRGAAGLVINASEKHCLQSLEKRLKDKLVLVVADTQMAFIKLAMAWREQFTFPVIGVTGSVGKTSTKEMLVNIFATNNMAVVSTQGTQNTRMGVAMNIFKMRDHHQVGVFELGISKRGEMAELAKILRPTTALITSIGHAHMEGLGSLADIAQEKRDIFKYFTENSIGIINGDQPILATVAYAHPVIRFGCKTVNQVQARKVHIHQEGASFALKLYRQKFQINLPFIHQGYISNSLAATAAAYLLNVPASVIIQGLQKPLKVSGRFEGRLLVHHKGSLIHDCYNANPESMKAALLAFQRIETKAQKIAVLGDMLELGVTAPFWHRQLGRFLRKVPSLQQLILVGNLVQWTKTTVPVGINVVHVPNWQEAAAHLEPLLNSDSVVLVKGSRGIALDKLVDQFTKTVAA